MIGDVSPHFQTQLRSELRRRQVSNPKYSLRAFARNLGMSPGFLSKILSGKRALSRRMALSIARKLNYSEQETALFCRDSVASLGATDNDPDPGFVTLSMDAFEVISDWHHYAILELAQCKGFKSNLAYISQRLGITVTEAHAAVSRLLRLGLLEAKRGVWRKTNAFLASEFGRSSAAARNHHIQMLDLAKRALETQSIPERHFNNFTLSLDPSQIEEFRTVIKKQARRLVKMTDAHPPKEVYQLSIQLFRLSKPSEGNEK